jgi:hypothetical protein
VKPARTERVPAGGTFANRKIAIGLPEPAVTAQLLTKIVVLSSRHPKLTRSAGSNAKAVGYALYECLGAEV